MDKDRHPLFYFILIFFIFFNLILQFYLHDNSDSYLYNKSQLSKYSGYDYSPNSDLFDEMLKLSIKFNKDDIVCAAKDNNGKIIFLETGNSKTGLRKILDKHGHEFVRKGVSEEQVSELIMRAVIEGSVVGHQGKGTGRPIYETPWNGHLIKVAVTVGSNGYVVGANVSGSSRPVFSDLLLKYLT